MSRKALPRDPLDRLPSGPPVVERRSRRARAVLVASVIGVALSALVFYGIVRFASSNADKVRLGDQVFEVARADRLAPRIAEEGPFLFKDPLSAGAGRELYVIHEGDDQDEGWLAVEAYAPGSPRELRCLLRYDPRANGFVDPCTDERLPPSGEGLVAYETSVDERGVVVVNLHSRAD